MLHDISTYWCCCCSKNLHILGQVCSFQGQVCSSQPPCGPRGPRGREQRRRRRGEDLRAELWVRLERSCARGMTWPWLILIKTGGLVTGHLYFKRIFSDDENPAGNSLIYVFSAYEIIFWKHRDLNHKRLETSPTNRGRTDKRHPGGWTYPASQLSLLAVGSQRKWRLGGTWKWWEIHRWMMKWWLIISWSFSPWKYLKIAIRGILGEPHNTPLRQILSLVDKGIQAPASSL